MNRTIFNLVETERILRKYQDNLPFYTRGSISKAMKIGKFPLPYQLSGSGNGKRVVITRSQIKAFIRKYIPLENLDEEELDKSLAI